MYYKDGSALLTLAVFAVLVITMRTILLPVILVLSVMGFLLAAFSTHGMIAQMGLLIGRGTLCSLFAVLFVLPGMLMTFDRFVIRNKPDTR